MRHRVLGAVFGGLLSVMTFIGFADACQETDSNRDRRILETILDDYQSRFSQYVTVGFLEYDTVTELSIYRLTLNTGQSTILQYNITYSGSSCEITIDSAQILGSQEM